MENADDWLPTGRWKTELGKGDPFAAAIRATRMPMIITDPRLDDNPIVFINDAFCKLTGYARDEIMGRNCRFLQGAQTDPASVQQVRAAIAERRDVDVDVLNYRKDGTPFWNALHISPVFNDAGELTYFFASQLDMTARMDEMAIKTMLLHEVDHRVKNNLQIVAALLAMEARTIADPAVAERLKATMARIEALSTIHRRLYQSEDVTKFDVSECFHDIVTHLVGSTGRSDIAIDFDLKPVHLPAQQASPLALIVNEVVTNAIKHAFASDMAGRLFVKVQTSGAELTIVIADDGIGMKDDIDPNGSFGTKLVTALSRQLAATTSLAAGEVSGTRFELRMPIPEI